MCVSFLSVRQNSKFPFVLTLNRDEFYSRPTSPLDHWGENGNIVGGKDLQGNGTWLGVDLSGRFAAVTNFRDGSSQKEIKRSRGLLVSEFLSSQQSPRDYLAQLSRDRHHYYGYNILVGSVEEIFHYSNQSDEVAVLDDGIHGLSNHLLNTPWPKVELGKERLGRIVSNTEVLSYDEILELMKDRSMPPDEMLPSTGVKYEIEKLVSSIFIESAKYSYGTRTTSIVFFDSSSRSLKFFERTYIPFTNNHEDREVQISL